MVYQLTKEEKVTIINQHLRTLAFSRYNYEVSLMEENSSPESSPETVLALTEQIGILDAKINALVAESESLESAV